MTAFAIGTGQKFRLQKGGEVFEFHSVQFLDGKCVVLYRKRANPRKIHQKEVESLQSLIHA